MKSIKNLTLSILATLALLTGSMAHAGMILEISDGSTTQTVSDTDGDGLLVYAGSVGSFALNVVGGYSNAGSGQIPAILDLVSLNVSSFAGGTLTVKLSSNNYDAAPGSESRALSTVGGVLTKNATALFQSYYDSGNSLFSTSTQLAELSYSGLDAFSGRSETGASFTGPYSMTLVATLTHEGLGVSSFNFNTSVPEPGTLALFGFGLLGFGISAALRRRNTTA